MERLSIQTISSEDITSVTLVATYTALDDLALFIQLYLEDLAGGGAYRVCLTKQIGGTGTVYQSPTTGIGVDATEDNLYVGTVPIPVLADDVVKVYVVGLATDSSVSGYVEFFGEEINESFIRSAIGMSSANLDTQLGAIQTDLDNPGQYQADVSSLALESTLTAIKGAGWSDETLAALKSVIDAISSGQLDQSDIRSAVGLASNDLDTQLAALQADLDNPSQYKADVSSLALEATLTAMKGAGWTDETLKAIRDSVSVVDGNVDDILADTDELQSDDIPSALSAIDGKIDTIDSIVDGILVDTGTTIPAQISGLNDLDADTILSSSIDGLYSLKDVFKLMAAMLAAKASGGGTDTITFRDLSDTLDRIIFTVDDDGNRLTATYNLT